MRQGKNQRAEAKAQQLSGMSLAITLSRPALAHDRGVARRQSAVDPEVVVDGLHELIGYPVEVARIRQEPMRFEDVGREGCRAS